MKWLLGMFLIVTNVFAKDATVIATYTDFYNDSDLVAECVVFSDGTGMRMYDSIVPYYKPEMFKVAPATFKKLNASLDKEAVGKFDKKNKTCNSAPGPYQIIGLLFDKIDPGYATAEARKVSNETDTCSFRIQRDHMVLEQTSTSALLLKDLCGFKDQ